MKNTRVDHIVYAFRNLDEGIKHVQSLTGAIPIKGGEHLEFGTHNALLSIGSNCYLELIAPDYNNSFRGKRWMSVDQISRPTITRWSINSNDINSDAEKLGSIQTDLGEIINGQRSLSDNTTLKWKMTRPSSNKTIGTLPFLLDWSQSNFHPCDKLEKKCKLISVKIKTQNHKSLKSILGSTANKIQIITSNTDEINLTLDTPNGIVNL